MTPNIQKYIPAFFVGFSLPIISLCTVPWMGFLFTESFFGSPWGMTAFYSATYCLIFLVAYHFLWKESFAENLVMFLNGMFLEVVIIFWWLSELNIGF